VPGIYANIMQSNICTQCCIPGKGLNPNELEMHPGGRLIPFLIEFLLSKQQIKK
jgi:hypothetical protein